MQIPLPKLSLFFLFTLFCLSVFAQNSKKEDQSATVNVTVTNTKNNPLKNAQVLFINTGNKKLLSGKTDASGKFSLHLPPGSNWSIKLKTPTDTIDYSAMEIPALQPGQFFTGAFSIDIQYEAPRSFTLDHVHFDTGKPTLRPDSFKELNEIAEYMSLKQDEQYEISGHTDNVGKDEDNLKLSQQRAESVKNYLVKKGINASRLIAKGYGASKPVADNGSEQGRQRNRRTEVIIL